MSESARGGKPSPQVKTIEADLATTRERMGETLEELGARLNPDRLKQQAMDTVREATIGKVQTMARNTMDQATKAGRAVTDVVRENPIPIAMIAAGIGWLVWNSRSRSNAAPQAARIGTGSRPPVNRAGTGSYRAAVNEEAGVVETVRTKAGEVVSAAQGVAHKATEGASHLASGVAENVQAQSTKVANVFQTSPLAIGAIAAAVGLAAGFMVPSTHKEGELLGEARDNLVGKARELVHEKTEQIQHVAQRVVSEVRSTATEAARQEGLTG
jgi:ElaB/YqjD/DUF883 family membrane-anchored ribosome-binding protein